jgi:hypothetical protein
MIRICSGSAAVGANPLWLSIIAPVVVFGISAIAPAANANWLARCVNEGGTCEAFRCIANPLSAKAVCRTACGLTGKPTSVSTSSCRIPGPPPPPPKKPPEIPQCIGGLKPGSRVVPGMWAQSNGNDSTVSCATVSPAYEHSIAHTVCLAKDAYTGPYHCSFGSHSGEDCRIGWSWPMKAYSSYIGPHAEAGFCVQFYNQSHNRKRNFRVIGVVKEGQHIPGEVVVPKDGKLK